MKFEKEIIEGVQVIKPYGRIDSNTSHEFEEILNREIEPGRDVEIDFREAVYISSSGLRCLLGLRKRLGDDAGDLMDGHDRCSFPIGRLWRAGRIADHLTV